MDIKKKKVPKLIAMLLALVMVFSILPISAFAAMASDIPETMQDNAILRALEYTGYNVQKQKDNGTLYQSGYYGSRLQSNAPDILSDISYGLSRSGKETVADSSTVTGLAPDIARFEKDGLCCASFVTYFICNYLPNIEGADTQFITDAVNATGMNSQAVVTWQKALEGLASQGKIEKVGTNSSNVDYNKLVPGDIIIFGNSTNSHVHTAIYAGTYNGTHFVIHVGNERGPEISTVEGMGHSSNGDKASFPNGFYHLPDDIFQEDGLIEVHKTDENGKALAGAVFIATNTKSGKSYRIGPTNNSGYAVSEAKIPFGTYKIVETVFPANYQASGKSEWTVTLDKNTPNATVTINAVNTLIPGSAKIVKTSEDGKVDGVSFHVQGNGIDQTVQTKNGGQIQIDNLMPGIYTVTELTEEKYEPQEVRRVTVVSGQTATVTFSNVLKRGDLTVTKTSEDGFSEGAKFHLFGTSLSGLAVDEYAVVGKDGKAYFRDVLIGTGYTLEEMDTAIRYVIPEDQTAAVEWNKVTNKSFENILKKWQLTVTKSDKETGTAQGDASLAGAKYGVFNGEQLMDVYETDRNGQFTTKSYVCGNDWSLREIEPSEGYLLNTESLHIGAEAKLYTAEFNLAPPLDSYETVKKGKIAVIKHCDDGETQIETPEEGAEFQVFLKSAGSYADAKETERDTLICDSYGFAESKLLPYGIYTVKQTKGWDGKELMPAFDVFVSENNEVYRYLINNATFESLIEIVKKDAETGKVIPAAGVGFKVRNTDTGEYIIQHINYPTPVDIDTYYTDTTGKLMMPEPLGFGNYELIEQCSAYGYVLDSTPVPFKVDGTQTTVVVEKHNIAQKGTITVGKTGEVFSSVTETDGIYQPVYAVGNVPDTHYVITAVGDIYTPDGTLRYQDEQVVARLQTGRDGTATTEPLYLGTFKICEEKAAYGMVISSEIKTVELTYAGENIEVTSTEVSFYNERQKAEISLSKILEQNELFGIGGNGEILSIQFGLFAAEDLAAADGLVIPKDGLLEIVNCAENGKAVFKTDIPVGAKLYVKETAADEHYLISDEKYPVEFVYAGQDIAVLEIQVNDGEAIPNDLIYGNIKGLKIDRETEEPIAGALFGLFRPDETEFTEETALLTAESQPDGVFTFEQIPYGNWIVKELRSADSFLPNEETYPVTVSEHEQLIEITVVNDRIPEIGTTAAVDGEKEICATEVFTLTDTVSYKHLIPDKEYVLKGVLMDKSTGKPLVINGEEIRSETVFTPEAPTGEAIVEFVFDSKYIKEDTDIVVFESLYKDGKELAVHADIEDEGQTVKVKIPEIRTQATADGKKEITANGRVKVEDVVSYNNLTPGKEYTVKGVLMDKSTGEPLLVDGEEIRSSFTFKPDAPDGEITVTFVFDASGLTSAAEIVVFEGLCRDDVEIAVHADIEDEGQTVKITPPVPDVPQTGDESNLGFWIGLGAVAVGGAVASAIILIKKKKDDDDE